MTLTTKEQEGVTVPPTAIEFDLHEDARVLRTLFTRFKHTMVEIATRLTAIQEREGWTTRELAEWCEVEQVGFESQSQVVKVLGYGRTVSTVIPNGIAPPAEGTIRPLTQALNQGLPPEDAKAVWAELTDGDKSPTAAEVAEVVAELPYVQNLQRERHKTQVVPANQAPRVEDPIFIEAIEAVRSIDPKKSVNVDYDLVVAALSVYRKRHPRGMNWSGISAEVVRPLDKQTLLVDIWPILLEKWGSVDAFTKDVMEQHEIHQLTAESVMLAAGKMS